MRSLLPPLLLSLLLLAGCSSEPTLADAEDLLQEGDPSKALSAARQAVRRAGTKLERLKLRRLTFKASLQAGLTHEAAREYGYIRQLLGREDDALLTELASETLRLAGHSRDASRRVRALQTLASVVDDERSRPLILAGLADEEPEVRAAAMRTAALLPSASLVLDLLQGRVKGDPHPVVRFSALRALRGLALRLRGRPREAARDKSLARLLDLGRVALRDPAEQVRLAAMDLLSALGDEASLRAAVAAALAGAIGNGSDVASSSAVRKLMQLDPERAWGAWRRAKAGVPALAPFTRALAAHVGQADAAALRADLSSPRYDRRLAAARGLLGPGARTFRRELLSLVLRDPTSTVRRAALEALLAAKATRGLRSTLLRVLRRGDSSSRWQAFLALDRLSPFSVAQLLRSYRSGDPAVVSDAARLLARRGGEVGLQALVSGLEVDALRVSSLAVLAERGEGNLRVRFRELLLDRDARVRRLAGLGLIRCGEPEDRAQLVRALEKPNHSFDLPAAAALLAIQGRLPRAKATPGRAPE